MIKIRKILAFEFKRLLNKKLILLLSILIVLIGILGYILYALFYPDSTNPKIGILNMYNAYTQFVFLTFAYIFANVFANDFSKGIVSFYRQIGISLKKLIVAKSILLFVLILPMVNSAFIIANILYKNNDTEYLLLSMLSVNLGIIFTVMLSVFIALLIKKTMAATIILYVLFIGFNVLNLLTYGMTNPADSNSFTTLILSKLADSNLTNLYADKMNIVFETQGVYIAIIVPVVWILILFGANSFLLRRKK